MTNPYVTVMALIIGVAFLQVSNGLIQLYLPMRMAFDQASTTAISVVAAAYSAGVLAGAVLTERMIRRVGHIRAFAVFAATSAVATLLFPLYVSQEVWMALRLVNGICYLGMVTVAEGWLNAQTPNEQRGGVLSFYMVASKMAVIGGQLALLDATDLRTHAYFTLASIGCSLALIPIALTKISAPVIPATARRFRPRRLWRISPVGVSGCFSTGFANTAMLSLVPAYLMTVSYPAYDITMMMIALQTGSLVLQWPLGRLSDLCDRRIIIAIISLVSAALAAVLAAWPDPRKEVLFILLIAWGAGSLSLYGICAAHANDYCTPGWRSNLACGLLMSWGVGATLGPLVADRVMGMFGPSGLFIFVASVMAGLGGFSLLRMKLRRAIPLSARPNFRVRSTSHPPAGPLGMVSPAEQMAEDGPSFIKGGAVSATQGEGAMKKELDDSQHEDKNGNKDEGDAEAEVLREDASDERAGHVARVNNPLVE